MIAALSTQKGNRRMKQPETCPNCKSKMTLAGEATAERAGVSIGLGGTLWECMMCGTMMMSVSGGSLESNIGDLCRAQEENHQ